MSGKLYVKIFLMFLVALLGTELIIFGLFRYSADKGPRNKRVHGQMHAAVRIVEDAWRYGGDDVSQENTVSFLAKSYGAQVWVTAPSGAVLASSPKGGENAHAQPPGNDGIGDEELEHGVTRQKDGAVYAVSSVVFPDGGYGKVHVLYSGKEEKEHELFFLQGLVHISLAVAVLIIPVSWIITGPLKRLNSTVLRFAEGDLSVRASEKSRDEIGALSKSFNHMADSLERMIKGGKELTANVSHELRSPLARMRVSLELAKENCRAQSCPGLDRHMWSMEEEIELMDRLIGRILLMSKMDLRQDIPMLREPLDLAALTEAVLSRHARAMEAKRIKLAVSSPQSLDIFGESDSLTDALENVFGNAVKFTPEDGDIAVELRRASRWAVLDVTNTSTPIPEDELEKMFHPFHRVGRSQADGSGLGLTIARRAVERNGGSIEAHNVEGSLKLSIRLPIARPGNLTGQRGA